MSGDPTMVLHRRLIDAEPSDWDEIREDVPIFLEHDVYEMAGGRKVMVVKGDTPPAGGRKILTVDKAKLQEAAKRINTNFDSYAKPVKFFVGHNGPPSTTPQQDQPDIIGYGCHATVGPFGPKGITALKVTRFIERGHGEEAAKYPERSPEYYPQRNEITGVALLKTDPRLPMGMVYGHGQGSPLLYGQGFDMADERDDTGKTPDEVRKDTEQQAGGGGDAGGTDTGDELSPEEAHQAMRFASHYERHHKPWKYMCDQYSKYASEASPTNGGGPAPAPAGGPAAPTDDPAAATPPPPPEEKDVEKQHFERRIAALEAENREIKLSYAREQAETMVAELTGLHIKGIDPKALTVQLTGLSPKARKARFEEIRDNYARDDEAVNYEAEERAQRGFLPVFGAAADEDPDTYSQDDAAEAGVLCEQRGWAITDDKLWKRAIREVKKARVPA